MEEYPAVSMERTGKIFRRSIHTFLKNYQYYTSIAAFFVLPVSVSFLLWQTVVPSMPFLVSIHSRLGSLFAAAGLPPSSQFFSLLNIKVSQTVSSYVFTLPFTLSFLLLAKAAVVQSLCREETRNLNMNSPNLLSLLPLYNPLLSTYLCNSFIILSANASAFFLFFLTFNLFDAFGYNSDNSLLFLSAAAAVIYSVILAHTFITCNLALIVAGMENSGGYLSILKACVLIRGRASTALSLALPVNFGLAALEALFQYRVVRAYHVSDKLTSCNVMEGLLIAYMYSLLILIDAITTCIFYKSCKSSSRVDECRYYRIEIVEEEDTGTFPNSKIFEELP